MSETCPKVGLADNPENPSEPPHSNPITNFDRGAGLRSVLFASIKPTKVCFTASAIKSRSDLLCCCSRIKTGFLYPGDISLNAVSNISN